MWRSIVSIDIMKACLDIFSLFQFYFDILINYIKILLILLGIQLQNDSEALRTKVTNDEWQ